MQPDERLDAWGTCHELTVQVYRATARWPASEVYGLAAQARRAACAATMHAAADPPAHGPERHRVRLECVLASLDRLRYALLLAQELGYTTPDEWEAIGRLAHRAGELIRAQLALLATPPRLLR